MWFEFMCPKENTETSRGIFDLNEMSFNRVPSPRGYRGGLIVLLKYPLFWNSKNKTSTFFVKKSYQAGVLC